MLMWKHLPPYEYLKTLQVSATPNYAADVEFKGSINHLTLNDHHLDPLRTYRPVNAL